MKKLIFSFILVFSLFFVVGCNDDNPNESDGDLEAGNGSFVEEKEKTASDIVNWLKNEWNAEGISTEKVQLPKEHSEYGGQISWSSDSELINIQNGLLEYVEYDEKITLNYNVSLNGETLTGDIEFTIIGLAIIDARDLFAKQINPTISSDLVLTTKFDYLGGTSVTWTSSDTEIISNSGKYIKPYDDSKVTIEYIVTTTNPATVHKYTKTVNAVGMTITEKAEPIIEWLDQNVGENGYLDEDIILPTTLVEYNATIKWLEQSGKELNISDYINNPILSGAIQVEIIITINGRSVSVDRLYKVRSSSLTDIWDKVELFLDQMASNSYNSAQKINSIYYQNGYIPFFTQGNLAVTQDIIEISEKHRPGTLKSSIECIVIHDTANTRSGANAENQVQYLKNGADGRYASWHYTVDDSTCIQTIPDNEVAWHAGDGSRAWGSTYYNDTYNAKCITGGNANGIGIESCVNSDGNYALTERNLAKLVAGLLIKYNLGFDRVLTHNDFAGKNCPALLRQYNLVIRFLYLVQLEYYGLTELKDVTFTYEPITNNIDSRGLIDANDKTGVVSYKVTATYNGVSKTYTKTVTF